jgi:hypothetical protein
MKNPAYRLIFIVACLVLASFTSASAKSVVQSQVQSGVQEAHARLPDITPMPTVTTPVALIQTPADRVLPPVGSNAGLVLGASVLVLIIIGGVLGSRRRLKH